MIRSLTPSTGPAAGGTVVRIKGRHLGKVALVRFGGLPATGVTRVDARTLTVLAPAHAAGPVHVALKSRGRWSRALTYTYSAPSPPGPTPPPGPPVPTVSSVSPLAGPPGGSRLTISGSGFTAASEVRLGDWLVGTDLVVVSPERIEVTAPPHQELESLPVRVTGPGGTSAPGAQSTFTYSLPPTFHRILPAYGPDTGGTRIVIDGARFIGPGGVTAVTFDGVPGTDLEVTSDATMAVTTPPHAAGDVVVRVSTGAGTSPVTFDSHFAYDAPVVPVGTAARAPLPGPATESGLDDVDCPQPSTCFAVGSFGARPVQLPLVEQLANGTWTGSTVALPPEAATDDPRAELTSVSCPAVDFCAAVGHYVATFGADRAEQPLLAVWNGTTWSSPSFSLPIIVEGDREDGDLVAVDCTPDRRCAAVGTRHVPLDGTRPLIVSYAEGAWSLSPVPMPADTGHGRLVDVDCTTAQCTAVGVVDHAGSPTPMVQQGLGETWTRSEAPRPQNAGTTLNMTAVSCSSDTSCAAVGWHYPIGGLTAAFVVALSGGAWTTATAPPPPAGNLYGNSQLFDVACLAGDDCTAVGTYDLRYDDGPGSVDAAVHGMVSIVDGANVPGSFQMSLPNASFLHPDVDPQVAVCGASDACASAGQYALGGYRRRVAWQRVVGDVLQPGQQMAMPADAEWPYVSGLAATGSTAAVAVGSYGDFDGDTHAWIVTGLPLGD